MKTRIENLLVALAILAGVCRTNATTVFPIATNASTVELAGGLAASGTNILVGYLSGTNVCVQLISTNGSLIGPPVTNGVSAKRPQVAFAGTNYLVLWLDSTSGNDYVQIVSAGGTEIGSPLLIAPATQAQALLSDGTNFLAVWQDNSSGYYHGQFLTSAGVLSGSAFVISTAHNNLASALGATNYFFVWQNTNGASMSFNTYGAIVSKSGSVGGAFQISQTASLNQNPLAVGFDGTNFFAIWNTETNQTASGAPIWNFYGRLVSQSGTFASGELLLNTNQSVDPSLAFDGANYLLGWGYDIFTTNADKNIFFQFLDRSATPVGSSFSPFSPQGTNSPLFCALIFGGYQFVTAATIGSDIVTTNGKLTGFTSGAVYGALIPKSTPPLRLTSLNYTNGQFSLLLTGIAGTNYIIQVSTNLAVTNWTAVFTNTATNGSFNFTDTHATNKSRFYRGGQQ